jgi:hypothetical protein
MMNVGSGGLEMQSVVIVRGLMKFCILQQIMASLAVAVYALYLPAVHSQWHVIIKGLPGPITKDLIRIHRNLL